MNTSLLTKTALSFLTIVVLIACTEEKKIKRLALPATDLTKEMLIPKPLETNAGNSAFALDQHTAIVTSQSENYNQVGLFLAEKIKEHIDLALPVNDPTSETVERIVYISESNNPDLASNEAYELYISKDSVIIQSKTAEGAFRGVQTLRQLIPNKSIDTLTTHKIWPVPTGKIKDNPNFAYRGAMLDVARHFFSVADVKKFIDLLAYYKYNTLHLHLSDDQGWRIEIKSWPKLTEVGGSTQVGGGPGGYYTQEEYKDIVAYAAKHYITIVPEIDMPGHTNAASVAYPFLNGNGKKVSLYTGTQVGFSTFDARKDTVYAFIDDVVREIASITPGPYFHIGGDESHVTKKKDYILFVTKVAKIAQKYGKQVIGWDEIVTADIDSNAIAQYWSSAENAKTAVEKGMKVILSPAKKAYLDMQYDTLSKYGLHWAGYVPVDTAYVWTPESYEGIPLDNILGIEAPLWSETISTIEELEYLAFPRAIGIAELGWSTQENRDWENYRVRLAHQTPYLERMNVNYYPSERIDWQKNEDEPKKIGKD